MKNVREIVLSCYSRLIDGGNLAVIPDLNNKISRDSGLDSLGIVEFIVLIEEELDITLDSVLSEIRQCVFVKDIVSLIERDFVKG